MIELLVAYLLWEGNAPAEWWGLYVAIVGLNLWLSWKKHKAVESANAEADRVVKKLFEGK
jgi:hypothetical protein